MADIIPRRERKYQVSGQDSSNCGKKKADRSSTWKEEGLAMAGTAVRLRVLASAVFLLCAVGAVLAAPPPDAAMLYVRDLVFDPLASPPKLAPALRVQRETGYAIVQYKPGRGQAVYGAIRAAGGRVHGPIARHGFLVGGLKLARLRSLPGVRFAGVLHPAYKLTPSLRTRAAGPAVQGKLDLVVSVFRNAAATARQIERLGGTARLVRTASGDEVLVATIPAKSLGPLAALAEVRSVEETYVPLPELDQAPVRIGVRAPPFTPPWVNIHGLDGTGQVLGIYDTGLDTGNPQTLLADFQGRVNGDVANWTNPSMQPTWAGLNYEGQPSLHGTFVTDAALGNGATSANQLLTGVAFAATAILRPFNADSNGLIPGYLNIDRALTNAFAAGALVHNDSWVPATGEWPKLSPVLNLYSVQGSAAIDTFTVLNPTMMVATSAGNYGLQGANTIGTLSCSKNSLAVGNAGNGNPPRGAVANFAYQGVNANAIAPSSSRGPAVAGRLKPEVVAPGAMVAMRCPQSMAATCPAPLPGNPPPPYLNQPGFAYSTGTSFSTPLVSGAAVLLRQYLATQTNLPGGTGMLVKALLVNGTSPLYDYAPDTSQGWGEINLGRSIDGFGAGDVMYFDSLNTPAGAFSFVQQGQSVVFNNVAFAANTQLAITLTWYDPEDATLAGALIDDLDLTLTLADGTVYRGGVLSMQNGQTVANGPADTVNNTEKLVLAQTPAGPATITVTATTLAPNQRQPFALVVSSVTGQASASKLRLLRPSPPPIPRPSAESGGSGKE
jgi:hypothetical protein